MSLLDRLVTGDPLLERLRLAARGTAAVVVAGAMLSALLANHRLSGTAAALGTLIALWVTIQANDQQRRARMITAALLPFVAAAAVAFAALLATLGPVDAPVAFVAVAFTGVWARRFGPRGFALGMMAIFGMFFTLFLRLPVSDLTAAAGAIAVGGASAFVLRFFALPDDPRLVLAAATRAFRVRAGQRPADVPRGLRRKQRIALNRIALGIDSLVAGPAFELDTEQRLAARLAVLNAEISADGTPPGAASQPDTRSATEAAVVALDCVRRAPRRAGVDAPPAPAPQPPNIGGMSPPTRQAIQVAAASASAIALGAMIPPHQYFWALLSAFLMFNQTASSSEARRRTVARIIGTVLGVGAGLIAIQTVHGKIVLEASVAFVGVFAALYVFRASYWAFTFFITTVIAIVYEIIGRPADQLLVERLVETLIGATCGGIVATVVFPLATKRVVAVRKDEFADRLIASSLAIDAWSRSRDGKSPLDAAREVDAAAQELLARARPLGEPPEAAVWHEASESRARTARALNSFDGRLTSRHAANNVVAAG